LKRIWLFPLAFWLLTSGAAAQPAAGAVPLDRAVVRFIAPETGGVRSPRFVFERVLAFEARLEALSDPDRTPGELRPYRERHVRAALERHMAEELLSNLRIDPEPNARDLARQTEAARQMLIQRAGGAERVTEAARAEGIDEREILRMLRRQARASLYLDRMVAPMLSPSDAELANLHRTVATPFKRLAFAQAKGALRRWYVGKRLAAALQSFYQNARSRIEVTVLTESAR
jgi:hypothetical protein